MKNKTTVKFLVLFGIIFSAFQLNAQTGIGIANPDSSSVLDLVSNSRGVLIPRLALEALDRASPIENPVNSLLVYNTKSAGDLKEGFYYWNNGKWIQIISALTDEKIIIEEDKNNNLIITFIENGQPKKVNITEIISGKQKYASLVSKGKGEYVFNSGKEGDAAVTIKVNEDIKKYFENPEYLEEIKNFLSQYLNTAKGSVHFDGNNFTYVDQTGNKVNLSLPAYIKANQAYASLVSKGKGEYVFNSGKEGDAAVTIKVNEDIKKYFENPEYLEEIKNFLSQYLNTAKGSVHFDGNNFTYVDQTGNKVNLALPEYIKANQAYASLVSKGKGEYVFNSGKDGDGEVKFVIKETSNDYSASEETKIGIWNDRSVMRIVREINFPTAFINVEINKAINGLVLEATLINKENNSITRGVVRKNVSNGKTTFIIGTIGTILTNHPAGDYYLIIEYVK